MGKETKIDLARVILATAVGAMRKPRGALKVINLDTQAELITAFVDETGYTPSSAKRTFAKLKAEMVEAGTLSADAPEAPAPVEKRVKKIDQARSIFNRKLKALNSTDMAGTAFRQGVINTTMKATDSNRATAAAMYNTCFQEAKEAGLVGATRLGRGSHPVDTSQPWARSSNGMVIDTYPTKKAAEADANLYPDQTVAKTPELASA